MGPGEGRGSLRRTGKDEGRPKRGRGRPGDAAGSPRGDRGKPGKGRGEG